VALSLLEEVVAPLADGIAMAARLLDPDRVVLGGGILEAGTVLIERLRWALQERSVKCPVESARLGGWSGTLGAAAYASGLDSHLPWTADELSPVTLT
jgi:glucokinase